MSNLSNSGGTLVSFDACSFVGVDFIICECGDNFSNEVLFREHLKRNHDEDIPVSDYKEEVIEEEIQYEEQEDFDSQETAPVTKENTVTVSTRIKNEQIEFIVEEQYNEDSFEVKEEPEMPDEASERELAFATESIMQDRVEESNIVEVPPVITTEKDAYSQKLVWLCEPCRKIFMQKQSYMAHQLKEHSLSCDQTMKKCYLMQNNETNETIVPTMVPIVTSGATSSKTSTSSNKIVKVVRNKAPKHHKSKQPRCDVKDRICEVCGKAFASNAALSYHQRIHTGEKPFKCELCPKSFTMPLLLQIHVRCHTGERPYQCPHCPKAFSNKAAINRHNRVHTGVKPYTCTDCGKSFTQSNSMKLHVRTVHLKLPAPYKSKKRKQEAEERQRQAMMQRVILKLENDEDADSEGAGGVRWKVRSVGGYDE